MYVWFEYGECVKSGMCVCACECVSMLTLFLYNINGGMYKILKIEVYLTG